MCVSILGHVFKLLEVNFGGPVSDLCVHVLDILQGFELALLGQIQVYGAAGLLVLEVLLYILALVEAEKGPRILSVGVGRLESREVVRLSLVLKLSADDWRLQLRFGGLRQLERSLCALAAVA